MVTWNMELDTLRSDLGGWAAGWGVGVGRPSRWLAGYSLDVAGKSACSPLGLPLLPAASARARRLACASCCCTIAHDSRLLPASCPPPPPPPSSPLPRPAGLPPQGPAAPLPLPLQASVLHSAARLQQGDTQGRHRAALRCVALCPRRPAVAALASPSARAAEPGGGAPRRRSPVLARPTHPPLPLSARLLLPSLRAERGRRALHHQLQRRPVQGVPRPLAGHAAPGQRRVRVCGRCAELAWRGGSGWRWSRRPPAAAAASPAADPPRPPASRPLHRPDAGRECPPSTAWRRPASTAQHSTAQHSTELIMPCLAALTARPTGPPPRRGRGAALQPGGVQGGADDGHGAEHRGGGLRHGLPAARIQGEAGAGAGAAVGAGGGAGGGARAAAGAGGGAGAGRVLHAGWFSRRVARVCRRGPAEQPAPSACAPALPTDRLERASCMRASVAVSSAHVPRAASTRGLVGDHKGHAARYVCRAACPPCACCAC